LAERYWSKKRKKVKATSSMLVVKGTKDHEKIVGNKISNTLIGGSGDDILDGRGGDDVLTGGPGADFFVISPGNDQITDFNSVEGDQIVYRSNDEIICFSEKNDALITTMDGVINTTISHASLDQVFLSFQQRLKPTFEALFESGRVVRLESAESSFQQSLGMMQREALPKRRGMMFPQVKAQIVPIYMFNCLAPLDIIYLNDGEIVELAAEIPICVSADADECPRYESSQPFDNWIELRSGSIRRLGLSVGSQVDLIPL